MQRRCVSGLITLAQRIAGGGRELLQHNRGREESSGAAKETKEGKESH